MKLDTFRRLFKEVNGFYLTETVFMFRDPVELWNMETDESQKFKSIDEALDAEIDGKKVAEIIDGLDDLYIPTLNMPKPSKGGKANGEFKFGHADQRGQGNNDQALFPARANTKIKSKTFAGALAEFKRNHMLADREFAYEVDDDGFVHQYVRGAKHSVGIGSRAKVGRGQRTMLIHNHPSGGAFSDADLLVASANRRTKGIIASGKKYDYTFEKRGNFKANDFMKAVKSARMTGKDYDEAVDNWLKTNQKKYGYKYTRTAN